MKMAVGIKQVVTRGWQLGGNDAKTWIRDQDASVELNEPDAYALEEALRLKGKHTGEVVVCSAGPARAAQVIREARAGLSVAPLAPAGRRQRTTGRRPVRSHRLLLELDVPAQVRCD